MLTHGEQTRNESYEAEQPVAAGKRAVVLEFVRARGKGGATREEIAGGTGFRLSSVCGRVNELEESGLLVTTNERRRGVSGKALSVVIAKEFAGGGTGTKGREESNGEAVRGDSPSDSGRAAEPDQSRSGGDVRDQSIDGPKHPLATQLAAFKAQRTEQQLNLF